MTSKIENVIWEGRYQPIHRGHLAYIRLLLRHAEHVWLFVVDNERLEDNPHLTSPVPKFSRIVDDHHVPEKNPLPFYVRYRAVWETVVAEFGSDAPVTVWGGRRLDLAWDYYKKALPPNRVFLTPERDEFEDAKAAAWEALGESVKRVDVSEIPKISASQLRDRLQRGESVEDLLPSATQRVLERLGCMSRLMDVSG